MFNGGVIQLQDKQLNCNSVTRSPKINILKRKTKKEPEDVKSKDGVIRRNLDRIQVSAATPLPSNPS